MEKDTNQYEWLSADADVSDEGFEDLFGTAKNLSKFYEDVTPVREGTVSSVATTLCKQLRERQAAQENLAA